MVATVDKKFTVSCPQEKSSGDGVFTLWDMYQFYAHGIVRILDDLRDLEIEVVKLHNVADVPIVQAKFSEKLSVSLSVMGLLCERLHLASALRQLDRLHARAKSEQKLGGDEAAPMLQELRRRIQEDLQDHAYYCIPMAVAPRFFKQEGEYRHYVPKVAGELMDPRIVGRFPSASDDIESAFKCYVLDCYPACTFHLMRIVEVAVLELAKLCGNLDPKPSWGSVLQQIEKLVLRTEYRDVPASIQPHRKFLEDLLPQMQAIQRAWRNKMMHVGEKLIPDSTVTEPIANELLVAVEAFMRELAIKIP